MWPLVQDVCHPVHFLHGWSDIADALQFVCLFFLWGPGTEHRAMTKCRDQILAARRLIRTPRPEVVVLALLGKKRRI